MLSKMLKLLSLLSLLALLSMVGSAQSVEKETLYSPRESGVDAFPYQVSIRSDAPENKHICSGGVISKTWILTAAHCLTKNKENYFPWSIVIFLISQIVASIPKRPSKRIAIHPKYTLGNQLPLYDYGLIEVDPIEFKENFAPLKLPDLTTEPYGLADVASLNPDTKVLSYVTDRIPDQSTCNKIYQDFNPETHLCVPSNLHENMCARDYGSPLVQNGTVVGIVSYIPPDCSVTVYAKMKSALEFIKKTIEPQQ